MVRVWLQSYWRENQVTEVRGKKGKEVKASKVWGLCSGKSLKM